jgi:serine/threonine protein kinase
MAAPFASSGSLNLHHFLDLKTENILLIPVHDSLPRLVIADFGHSTDTNERQGRPEVIGTKDFMPPELAEVACGMRRSRYDLKVADAWSLGGGVGRSSFCSLNSIMTSLFLHQQSSSTSVSADNRHSSSTTSTSPAQHRAPSDVPKRQCRAR